MLYREIIAVCSQIHTKHTNTPCGQNVEFVNVKLVVHIDYRPSHYETFFGFPKKKINLTKMEMKEK